MTELDELQRRIYRTIEILAEDPDVSDIGAVEHAVEILRGGRERHIHCVRKSDRQSWCGKILYLYNWVFTDAEHARLSLEQSTFVVPCEACMVAIGDSK